jgi:hypothetical protein
VNLISENPLPLRIRAKAKAANCSHDKAINNRPNSWSIATTTYSRYNQEIQKKAYLHASPHVRHTVLCAQNQIKIFHKRLASQAFYEISCGSFDRKLL